MKKSDLAEDAIVKEKPKRSFLNTIFFHWGFWLIMSVINAYFLLYNIRHGYVGFAMISFVGVTASSYSFFTTFLKNKKTIL